jgi:hypothetical protein
LCARVRPKGTKIALQNLTYLNTWGRASQGFSGVRVENTAIAELRIKKYEVRKGVGRKMSGFAPQYGGAGWFFAASVYYSDSICALEQGSVVQLAGDEEFDGGWGF